MKIKNFNRITLLSLIISLINTSPALKNSETSYAIGINPSRDAGTADIGIISHPARYLFTKISLSGLLSEEDDFFTGMNMGLYAHLPARVSPYIGVGIFTGYSQETTIADQDNIDNDNDGFVDELNEQKRKVSGTLATIHPEAGLHLSITSTIRLTLFSTYHYSSGGREDDFWVHGIGFSTQLPE